MKLGDQVVSIERAKRLKEIGVKQESVFCWQKRPYIEIDERGIRTDTENFGLYGPILPFDSRVTETVSAFTVSELLEILRELGKESVIIPVVPEEKSVADYLARYVIQEKSKLVTP